MPLKFFPYRRHPMTGAAQLTPLTDGRTSHIYLRQIAFYPSVYTLRQLEQGWLRYVVHTVTETPPTAAAVTSTARPLATAKDGSSTTAPNNTENDDGNACDTPALTAADNDSSPMGFSAVMRLRLLHSASVYPVPACEWPAHRPRRAETDAPGAIPPHHLCRRSSAARHRFRGDTWRIPQTCYTEAAAVSLVGSEVSALDTERGSRVVAVRIGSAADCEIAVRAVLLPTDRPQAWAPCEKTFLTEAQADFQAARQSLRDRLAQRYTPPEPPTTRGGAGHAVAPPSYQHDDGLPQIWVGARRFSDRTHRQLQAEWYSTFQRILTTRVSAQSYTALARHVCDGGGWLPHCTAQLQRDAAAAGVLINGAVPSSMEPQLLMLPGPLLLSTPRCLAAWRLTRGSLAPPLAKPPTTGYATSSCALARSAEELLTKLSLRRRRRASATSGGGRRLTAAACRSYHFKHGRPRILSTPRATQKRFADDTHDSPGRLSEGSASPQRKHWRGEADEKGAVGGSPLALPRAPPVDDDGVPRCERQPSEPPPWLSSAPADRLLSSMDARVYRSLWEGAPWTAPSDLDACPRAEALLQYILPPPLLTCPPPCLVVAPHPEAPAGRGCLELPQHTATELAAAAQRTPMHYERTRASVRGHDWSILRCEVSVDRYGMLPTLRNFARPRVYRHMQPLQWWRSFLQDEQLKECPYLTEARAPRGTNTSDTSGCSGHPFDAPTAAASRPTVSERHRHLQYSHSPSRRRRATCASTSELWNAVLRLAETELLASRHQPMPTGLGAPEAGRLYEEVLADSVETKQQAVRGLLIERGGAVTVKQAPVERRRTRPSSVLGEVSWSLVVPLRGPSGAAAAAFILWILRCAFHRENILLFETYFYDALDPPPPPASTTTEERHEGPLSGRTPLWTHVHLPMWEGERPWFDESDDDGEGTESTTALSVRSGARLRTRYMLHTNVAESVQSAAIRQLAADLLEDHLFRCLPHRLHRLRYCRPVFSALSSFADAMCDARRQQEEPFIKAVIQHRQKLQHDAGRPPEEDPSAGMTAPSLPTPPVLPLTDRCNWLRGYLAALTGAMPSCFAPHCREDVSLHVGYAETVLAYEAAQVQRLEEEARESPS